MGLMDRAGPSRVLEGIHGVQLVGQPTYRDETLHCGEFVLETCDGPQAVGSSQGLLIQQRWHQRPACFRPICCRLQGDQNIAETIANVLTSLPFIFLGFRAPRKNLNTSLYANSLIGVGIASSLYHSSRGEVRKILRWADYTMIAASTVCLSRALRDENPKLLTAASTLLLPFQPFMVSAVHTGLMESFLVPYSDGKQMAIATTFTLLSKTLLRHQTSNAQLVHVVAHLPASVLLSHLVVFAAQSVLVFVSITQAKGMCNEQ